jgi:hypothetical protein
MFLNALAYCIINIQEGILDDTIAINVDFLNGNFISYWDNCGTPINKNDKRGVMTYIIESVKEYLYNSDNEFLINTEDIFKRTYEVIDQYYSNNIDIMEKKDEICKEKKKALKGKIEKEKLLKLLKSGQCGNKLELCKEQYIESMLYMPDINYVKIHKFLNNCCLKKLDDTFNDNVDLKNAKRTDLIGFKEVYAKKRITNKPRDLRFIPIKDTTAILNDDEEVINRIYLEDYIYNINNHSKIVREWLYAMKEKNNSLFPINIIKDFENNNIKSIKSGIIFNVGLLTKTSKHVGEEFIDNFNNVKKKSGGKKESNDKIKYQSIIRAIMKILYTHLKNSNNSDEINMLLNNSIKDLKDIIIDLKALNNIYNDEIENEIDIINKYIVSRALCSPFNIEQTLNGKIISNVISHLYIEKITTNIYKDVLEIIKLSFPTMEENIDFLNKQREENKQGKLKVFNDKTVEDIKLIREMKKAGINYDIIQEKINEVNEVDEYNYDMQELLENNNDDNNVSNYILYKDNNVGENVGETNDMDNKMTSNDREDDDEYMDTQDMEYLHD